MNYPVAYYADQIIQFCEKYHVDMATRERMRGFLILTPNIDMSRSVQSILRMLLRMALEKPCQK